MISLNIKDYIIAGLLAVIVGLGATIAYKDIRFGIMKDQLHEIERLQEQAQRRYERIEEDSQREKKEADEKYNGDIAELSAHVKRLRDSNASYLPAVAKSAGSAKEISFQRAELDTAIRDHEQEIQVLIAKGAECEIDLRTLQNWWYNVEAIYR